MRFREKFIHVKLEKNRKTTSNTEITIKIINIIEVYSVFKERNFFKE